MAGRPQKKKNHTLDVLSSTSAAEISDTEHAEAMSSSGCNKINFQEVLDALPPADRETGERLRRHLQFFFMDTLWKWRVRRQIPYKLLLQVLKIILITAQLILFAELRMSHVDFVDETDTVMRHKFLRKWSGDRNTLDCSSTSERYAVYNVDDLIEEFSYIVCAYYHLQEDSFASFSYDTAYVQRVSRQAEKDPDGMEVNDPNKLPFGKIPYLRFCLERIANVSVFNNTYDFDITPVHDCYSLNFTEDDVRKVCENSTSAVPILAKRGISFKTEDALIISEGVIYFNLRTIHFSPIATDQRPECYLIAVSILFDNSHHTGQVYVSLSTEIGYVNLCNGRILKGGGFPYEVMIMGLLDVVVLLVCIASFILCCRALIRAHLLKKMSIEYFEQVLKCPLSISDQLEFLNLWYVMIVISDVCMVSATLCKITIEFRDFDNSLFNTTGILLGIGALLVYVGVLRYFGFFSKYNVLILTMKKALPNILRFMSCAAVLYAGFLVAGWVIIGPYSLKFRTLGQASEALFSLLNGDDMFATFYTISDTNALIKIVGTIYVYVFVSLFIYVVLSLFIAIIMDAYEIVKVRF
ncbi:unnamed protein product [Enterobius vermicularis]|uniref:PKD_channel domain-containing protein n=1 Tax=Enterobius vermicularis TaxID=51028 RepID=A0A0N4UZU0_ENTVE|nr:unnamed protein product [Enterobius vermicularis]